MSSDFHPSPGDRQMTRLFQSRTQRKAELAEVAKFAEELVEMVPAKFERLSLSAELRQAIEVARSISSHAARKRQMKKVEQFLDQEDLSALRKSILRVDHLRPKRTTIPPPPTESELLAARLLDGDDQDLFSLVERLGRDAVAQLRSVVRNAQREIRANGDKRVQALRSIQDALEVDG
jgi:ribosome-associated protein